MKPFDLNPTLVESSRVDALAVRVARRFFAKEFPTPEALKQYLKDHPQADKSKHYVEKGKERKKSEPPPIPKKKAPEPPPLPKKKPAEPPPLPKKPAPKQEKHNEHGDDHDEDETSIEKVVGNLKSFGQKAMDLFFKAPKAAQDFVTKPEVRRKVIAEAQDVLKSAPSKLVKSFIDTAKHEVHEFKEAGEGVAAVLKGGKMSKSQRKAFKTVTFHLGLTITATALTTTSALAGATMFTKAMAKHVAMKAVHRSMGHLHVLEEMGHVGHGIAHVLHKMAADESQNGKKADPEEVLVKFVMASVAKELEDLDSDGIGEALADADADDEEPESKSKS